MVYVFKTIGLIILIFLIIFCLKRTYYAFMNILALRRYRKDPSSLPQHHSMVFNKKTGKLEADNSPILPYE